MTSRFAIFGYCYFLLTVPRDMAWSHVCMYLSNDKEDLLESWLELFLLRTIHLLLNSTPNLSSNLPSIKSIYQVIYLTVSSIFHYMYQSVSSNYWIIYQSYFSIIYLSISLSIFLSIYLSVYLSFYLSIYLSQPWKAVSFQLTSLFTIVASIARHSDAILSFLQHTI